MEANDELLNVFSDFCFAERMMLESILELCDPAEQPDICRSLLDIATQSPQYLRKLVETCLKREIERTEDPNLLLRADSFEVSILSEINSAKGNNYLKKAIGPTLKKILKKKESFEIDPEKIEPSGDAQENENNLVTAVTLLLERIFKSVDEFPMEILDCCLYAFESTADKFPESKFQVLGGVIFLRFMCPWIVLFKTKNAITPESFRKLVLIAKVIQSIANEQVNSEYSRIRALIRSSIPKAHQFCNELIDLALKKSTTSFGGKATPEKSDNSASLTASKIRLLKWNQSHLKEICAFVLAKFSENGSIKEAFCREITAFAECRNIAQETSSDYKILWSRIEMIQRRKLSQKSLADDTEKTNSIESVHKEQECLSKTSSFDDSWSEESLTEFSNDVSTWDKHSLNGFLRTLKMDQVASILLNEEIEGDVFLTLTKEDLQELGITFGNRKKVLQLIQKLKDWPVEKVLEMESLSPRSKDSSSPNNSSNNNCNEDASSSSSSGKSSKVKHTKKLRKSSSKSKDCGKENGSSSSSSEVKLSPKPEAKPTNPNNTLPNAPPAKNNDRENHTSNVILKCTPQSSNAPFMLKLDLDTANWDQILNMLKQKNSKGFSNANSVESLRNYLVTLPVTFSANSAIYKVSVL